MKTEPRVLHVLSDDQSATPVLQDLIGGIAAHGIRQWLCFLQGGEHARAHPLAKHGLVITALQSTQPRALNPLTIARLSQFIRANAIDIVHCQRHKPTVYGTFAAWFAGPAVKVIATVRGRERTRNWRRQLLNQVLFQRVARITTVANAVREDVLASNPGLSPSKVITLYNGIDTQRFANPGIGRAEARERLGWSQDAFVFGSIGRLAKVKAQHLLLQAFAEVGRRYPATRLALVGQGPLEAELRALAAALGVAERVRFLGQRQDIPQVLAALDAFVLCSLSEGHPLALLEAMAAGVPPIATRVGGVPEIIVDGAQGIIIKPDSAAELGAAMLDFRARDRAALAAIGEAARQRVGASFSNKAMVDATLDLYRRL